MIAINRRGGFTPPPPDDGSIVCVGCGVKEHLNKVSCYEI